MVAINKTNKNQKNKMLEHVEYQFYISFFGFNQHLFYG